MMSNIRPEQIDQKEQTKPSFDLFDLAFRPGFLGASLFSSIALTLWILVLSGQLSLPEQAFLHWYGTSTKWCLGLLLLLPCRFY